MGGLIWYVYILTCSDGSYYTGITNNLKKRLVNHNKGRGSKYTRSRLPVYFSYAREAGDRSDASKEEYRIKSLRREKKEELILSNKFNFNLL